MDEKKFAEHLDKGRTYLSQLLNNKTSVKLDVYQNTLNWFKVFKDELKESVELIRKDIPDARVRLRVIEKGDTDVELYIGSDAIVFSMHTNIFQLDANSYSSRTSYVQQNPMNGYCGIINVYNFLADSYEYNRLHDVGYLISRIFINRESHFLIEGKGQLGFIYKDFMHQILSKEIIQDIILRLSIHAVDFDLYTPPYKAVQKATVQDLRNLNHSSKLKTGKRLGFKFESRENIT
ncbi:hypothetical protein [Crocinitomix algicola]|uniref:hypothetical protein n=1 Tax=Crocinitomix algicola TaxID=1740263 RepID=UPI0008334B7F|nr:hypothetical protein [Crocinitomix algicola]